ncbi:MAG: trigger factor [gamma proteobacterium symbiont of Bathyaustriella thionipta]|nr:trigger factor [gamma proteobacterium symbiont of Bathyaustriella thionipta]MCU7949452.1 trigger factor [gamma proteobacterium symbiont of Bathyaustriella thionipta]MCU7951956.1 trigger factor [gamma proteobacterium symbiont of Bathyaustriella thionipta]MCU7956039.1 trigger factor [gamma proteobacterium symbiont of Bathyaustriella thionipta]MCU7965928.1 trigger factor [gamma proteobacterium symbiont of Bathyaustriella thionipta]
MQVSVETKEGLERELTVEFPTSDINGEVNTRLQSLTKTAKINGFRPGKIPMAVIKKRYGGQVEAEVLNEKLQQSYFEAVNQEKLKPAGQPTINMVENDDKDNISYTAIFEVYPEITPASLEGQSFEKANVTIGDADIDSTVENIRKQNQTFIEVDRAAQDEDQVVVDFVGTIDGEAFKGNEGKQVPVTLGQGQMIEGFEQGVKGAKSGDSLTLDLKFPGDYHYKDVAGKDVQFAVTVLAIKEATLPELNDEFYTKFGITEGGMDAFREEVKKNMQLELDKAIAARLKNQVMDSIMDVNEITVPKSLVEEEAKNMAEQMQSQYQMETQGDAQLQTSLFEDQAKKRVSLGMILAELVKVNEITASQEVVMEKINEMAATYENPQEVMDYYMSHKEKLAEIESFVLEEKIVDWACEQATVSDKDFTFTEFMNPKNEDEA